MRAVTVLSRLGLPAGEVSAALSGPGMRLPLLAAAGGTAIGLFLILFAVEMARELSVLVGREAGTSTGEYLVISHQPSPLGTLARLDRRFLPEEIEELRSQPFVTAVGPITMSRFQARLTGTESIPFTTELFFEAVPDPFLGATPEGWKWRSPEDTLPLLVSRDFLQLYNHGFAVAYHLPQLTPHTVQNLRLSLQMGGDTFTARVVGFSDRFNSILVPDAFLSWANARYAPHSSQNPARVVLHVERSEHRQLAAYLEQKGYETNRDKLKSSRLWNLLVVLGSLAGVLGGIITLLALLVTVISFQLCMTRQSREINLLVHLGIPPNSIVRFYLLKASLLIGTSSLIGVTAADLCSSRLEQMLERFGYSVAGGFPLSTVATATLIATAGILSQYLVVRRHVSQLT